MSVSALIKRVIGNYARDASLVVKLLYRPSNGLEMHPAPCEVVCIFNSQTRAVRLAQGIPCINPIKKSICVPPKDMPRFQKLYAFSPKNLAFFTYSSLCLSGVIPPPSTPSVAVKHGNSMHRLWTEYLG